MGAAPLPSRVQHPSGVVADRQPSDPPLPPHRLAELILQSSYGKSHGATILIPRWSLGSKPCSSTDTECLLPIEAHVRKMRTHYVEQLRGNRWNRPALWYPIAVDVLAQLAVVPIVRGRVIELDNGIMPCVMGVWLK